MRRLWLAAAGVDIVEPRKRLLSWDKWRGVALSGTRYAARGGGPCGVFACVGRSKAGGCVLNRP